jgi:hypothetical protein
MAKSEWVIQRHDPDAGDDCDWQQFELGTVTDGYFLTIATFWDEADALKFRSAIQWLETLEEFTISAAPVPAIKPRTKARSRSNR